MKRYLIAAALILASTSAWAIPFQGTYNVTVNAADPGLKLIANPVNGNLFFDLNLGETTNWITLFSISADENSVDDNDDQLPIQALIDFSFSLPEIFGGQATGSTWGVKELGGLVQYGTLVWDNDGQFALNFGNGGTLNVVLQDAKFSKSLFGLSDVAAKVKAKFTYSQASVPEPGMLSLLGLGMLCVGLIRRRRSQ